MLTIACGGRRSEPVFICHLVNTIEPTAGGPAYSIPRLCDGLRQAGDRVELLTLTGPQQHLVRAEHNAFPIVGPRRLGHSPGMWRWLKENVSGNEPTILHSHNLWALPSIYPHFLSRRTGVPHVVSPRGTLTDYSMNSGSRFKRVYWPFVQLPALRQAIGLHATATSELEDIRRFGLSQPVAVIPNGIDVPDDSNAGRPHGQSSKVVLYLGRIHPEKGLACLLEAWAAVHQRHADWKLRIVGPDVCGYKAELARLLEDRRISGVEFADPVYGKAEKTAVYRSSAIYVLPSPSENFGVTIAEALVAGVPVVANHGAPWEGVVENRCGWWIPHGPAPLATTLTEAIGKSDDELREMGERGRIWMHSAFGWPHVVSRMRQFYAYLLEGGPRPSFVDVAQEP